MLPGSIPEGTRLGDYRIVSELGRGGMGVVYRAHDERLARDVAIKVLPREVGQDPRSLERFRREARAVAAVSHPGVTTIYQVSAANGWPCIVFELMGGGTLQDRLRRDGPIPWRDAVALAVPVLHALAAVHGAGLVHRDLKPANILLDTAGRPKLSDFGLVLGATSASLTGSGEVVGTAMYIAPEQAGEGPVGPAADLYSMGCTLSALLLGEPPFGVSRLLRGRGRLALRAEGLLARAEHGDAPAPSCSRGSVALTLVELPHVVPALPFPEDNAGEGTGFRVALRAR